MRLFRVCPDAYDRYSPQIYKPEEGIALGVVRNVPCLTSDHYTWVSNAIKDRGIDINCHILPVALKKETSTELKEKIRTRKYSSAPIVLKYASLHKSSNGVSFLQEEECFEDQNVLVSLELPLSAAQPYYEFEGDTEVLLGVFATYYGKCKDEGFGYEIEKENALCSAIVRMGDKAKVSIKYTNRYGQGEIIKNIVGQKFEFVCSNGHLLRLDDCNFKNLFSDFAVSEE